MNVRRICALSAMVLTLAATSFAGSIFHIGPGVTSSCPYGGCPTTDPNNIGPHELDISVISGGALKSSLTDVLLLLALPNDTAGTFLKASDLSVSSFDSSLSFISNGTVSGPTFKSGMGSGDEIFSFMGLTGGNNSNSFVNFLLTDGARGVSGVTSYGVYAFLLSDVTLGDKGALDVLFDLDLPAGTVAAAYASVCEDTTLKIHPLKPPKCTVFDNAYTEAGFVPGGPPRVPEPGSLVLLGSGLIGLASTIRRRFTQK